MSEGKGTGAGPATAGGSTKGNSISGGATGEKVVKIAGTGTVTLPSRKSLVPKVERLSEEKEELKRAARVVPWPKRGGVLKFRTSFTNTVLDVMTEKGWERTQVSILYTSIRIYVVFCFFCFEKGDGGGRRKDDCRLLDGLRRARGCCFGTFAASFLCPASTS